MGNCSISGETIRDFLTGRSVPDSDDEQIRQGIERLLVTNKGYLAEEVEVDRRFELDLDGRKWDGVAGLVVRIRDHPFMHISCHRGSIVTREHESLAASRLAYDVVVPYTVVTNGQEAELLDTHTGRVVAEGLEALPTRDQAIEMLPNLAFEPLAAKKREKNARIYLAYEVFDCLNFCRP
jgi:hypothetical protein